MKESDDMSRYEDLSGMSQWASWCCDGNDYEYVSVSDMIWILRQAEGGQAWSQR